MQLLLSGTTFGHFRNVIMQACTQVELPAHGSIPLHALQKNETLCQEL